MEVNTSKDTLIYLADLVHTHSIQDSSMTVPLGLGYIASHAYAAFGDTVTIKIFKHPNRLLRAIEAQAPDVVGLAHYGWNANLNYAIGNSIRNYLPKALIVAGGPNLDPDPETRINYLKKHHYLDYYIVDGGEEPFSELISWWRSGTDDKSQLPRNLVWREGQELRQSEERPLNKIISGIESPYLSGTLDEFLAAGMIPMFETNRGCPFRCTFCAWGIASKDLVRRFDLKTALAELEYVAERSKAANWIICDANFGILKRDIEIAQAIRSIKDRHQVPQKCHIFLAKNATKRNLEIGEILAEMSVPVMALQTLDKEALVNIKRDNISKDTYQQHQQHFSRLGMRTYCDLIIPLPGETLASHLEGLRTMFTLSVDIIQCHNCRMLAGAELNSRNTREQWNFQTKYRLIHGDAGEYRGLHGETIRCFEYEESLRSTSTMQESETFFLRKLHFLIDFCWNIDVYKPLLRKLLSYDCSPIDIFQQLLNPETISDSVTAERLAQFWSEFEVQSLGEWYESETQIEEHFSKEENFQRLINQEFEKLNILFSLVVLRDYKRDFDQAFKAILKERGLDQYLEIRSIAELTFALFPAIDREDFSEQIDILLPGELETCVNGAEQHLWEKSSVQLKQSPQRVEMVGILRNSKGLTLSKILNTQAFSLHDLKLTIDESYDYSRQIRRLLSSP